MEKVRKVIFVTNSVLVYGGELSLLEVLRNYRDAVAYSILVVVPEKGPFSAELERIDIKYVVIKHYKWLAKPIFSHTIKNVIKKIVNYFAIKKLTNIAKRFEANVIYTNSITANIGVVAAVNLDIPHIWHLREFLHEDIGTLFITGKQKARELINRSSTIICNSIATKRAWADFLSNDKLVVIYNGFPFVEENAEYIDRYQSTIKDQRSINLAIIGSIHPHKNQILAVKSVAELKALGVKICLRIFGEGNSDYVNQLKNLAHELDISNNIEWMGYVNNPFNTLADVAMTVMCSKNEAFGRVIVESMGKGIPVVAPNCGGIPEIITSGVTGLLYDVNSQRELTEKVMQLIEDKKLYNDIVNNAREEVVRNFSVKGYLENIDNVIDKVMTDKSRLLKEL